MLFTLIRAAGMAAALLGTLCVCSCGHNAIVLDKGVGFRAGFDPEHLSADVRLVYGEALTVAARDNFEVLLQADVEGGQESAAASARTGPSLRIKVGPQVNGYFVEAVGAGATAGQIRALQSSAASSPD